MSTLSPNFNLVLATTSDTVSVTSHLANNFSTLDSLLSIVHTGTGQLKNNLTLTSPTLVTPVISGTAMFNNIVATTGKFNTITATGGAVTLNTFNIGTYSFPTTAGAANTILTVVTGNAQWVAASPGTGANQALSNLTTIAFNTSMNTATGGFFTLDRLIVTSGALTGLTSFQATTGTFAGNLAVTGTLNATVLNVTGGAATFSTLAVGTFALPGTQGANGTILKVTTGAAVWYAPATTSSIAFSARLSGTSGVTIVASANTAIPFNTVDYDPGSNYTAASGVFTTPTSGIYEFNFFAYSTGSGAISLTGGITVGFLIAATSYPVYSPGLTGNFLIQGNLIRTVGAGVGVSVILTHSTGGINFIIPGSNANGVGFIAGFSGKRLYEF